MYAVVGDQKKFENLFWFGFLDCSSRSCSRTTDPFLRRGSSGTAEQADFLESPRREKMILKMSLLKQVDDAKMKQHYEGDV